jgi:hypothetical protein
VWISVCIISRIDFLCGFQRVLKSRIVAPQIETEAKAPYICWIFRRAEARALSAKTKTITLQHPLSAKEMAAAGV